MSRKTENPDPGAAPTPPRKKPLSRRQLAANRANAKKCAGPTTLEGKARSRFNALKHGLCALNVCLPGEDEAEFEFRRKAYIDHYQPANLVEWDLVEDLAAARWRKNRIVNVERILLLDTVLRKRLDTGKHYSELSLDAETALAFRDLIDESGSLRLLDRYENRVQFNIVTATRLIDHAQNNRPPVQNGPELFVESDTSAEPELNTAPEPNESIPENEHPALTPVGNATRPGTIVPRPAPPADPAAAPQRVLQAPQNTAWPQSPQPPAARPQLLSTGSGY